MSLNKTQVSKLYVAIFGRASEEEGNSYWQDQKDMITSANNMLNTSAAKSYFGETLDNNQDFIEFIYKNTLNKTIAEDFDGIKYWTSLLDNGKSKGEVVNSLIQSIDSYAPGEKYYDASDEFTINSYNQFLNRVNISNYTADTVLKLPSDYAKSLNFNKDLNVSFDDSSIVKALQNIENIIENDNYYKNFNFDNYEYSEYLNGDDFDFSSFYKDFSNSIAEENISDYTNSSKPIYVESIVSTDVGNNGSIDYSTEYTYSFDNGVLKQYSNGFLESEYLYNSDGLMIEERSIYNNEVDNILKYTYNSNGQILTMHDDSDDYDLSTNYNWSENSVEQNGTMLVMGQSISFRGIGTGLNSKKDAPIKWQQYIDNKLDSIGIYTYDKNGNEILSLEDEDANGSIDYAYHTQWIEVA